MVKCVSPPNFKYICFDHLETRLYKGEGSVNLVAYYPYALATFSPFFLNTDIAMINNVGDLDAQIKILYKMSNAENLSSLTLEDIKNNQIDILKFNQIENQGEDSYILINSKTHLIEGLDSQKQKTGNLYNKFIKSGDFFNAPVGRSKLISNVSFDKMEYTPLYY